MDTSIIKLNVGGVYYTTTRTTLTMYKDSMLARMFSEDNISLCQKDEDGRYFIDRNGKIFEYVLDYLRDGDIPSDKSLYCQLLREANFFLLDDLIKKLEFNKSSDISFVDNLNDLIIENIESNDTIMHYANQILSELDTYIIMGFSKIEWIFTNKSYPFGLHIERHHQIDEKIYLLHQNLFYYLKLKIPTLEKSYCEFYIGPVSPLGSKFFCISYEHKTKTYDFCKKICINDDLSNFVST